MRCFLADSVFRYPNVQRCCLASQGANSAERKMGSGVTGWRKHARAIGGVVAFTGLMSLLKLHEWVASRIEDLEQVEATERPVSWYLETHFQSTCFVHCVSLNFPIVDSLWN